ncbi:MAG: FtsH protease activity modulator HflK [Candidatus Acetothermia bacterium]
MPTNYDFRNQDEDNKGKGPETQKWLKRLNLFAGRGALIIIALLVVIYLAQGLYQVQPSETGLVKRFGKHVRTVGPGLHYHLPPPVESVDVVDIQSVRKIEIGYETVSPPPNPRYKIKKDEALMLTGDDNIVHLEMAIQYRVKDAEKFAFNIIDPRALIKEAAEAVIRRQVVRRTVQEAITSERTEVGVESHEVLQRLLDTYQTGVQVEAIKVQDAKPPEPVISAFDDVTSAKEDKSKEINESESYRNEVVPAARGRAAEITNKASAYREEQINKAEGETSRFSSVLQVYSTGNQAVTKTRMYIETMEEILPDMEKVLLTESGNQSSVLKLLNLDEIGGEKQ